MVGFSTDGASSMAGRQSGLRTPSGITAWFTVNNWHLKSRVCPSGMHCSMVVTMVNYINPHLCTHVCLKNYVPTRALNMKTFHSEARWLSRGNVLERFFTVRNKLLASSIDVGKKKKILSSFCVTSRKCAPLQNWTNLTQACSGKSRMSCRWVIVLMDSGGNSHTGERACQRPTSPLSLRWVHF